MKPEWILFFFSPKAAILDLKGQEWEGLLRKGKRTISRRWCLIETMTSAKLEEHDQPKYSRREEAG